LITATITKAIKPVCSILLNKNNLAKKPKIGIPAIDNKEAVSMAANNGLVFPSP
jgi:hypothetical protein